MKGGEGKREKGKEGDAGVEALCMPASWRGPGVDF